MGKGKVLRRQPQKSERRMNPPCDRTRGGKRERTLPACSVLHPCRTQGEGGQPDFGCALPRGIGELSGKDAEKGTLEARAPLFRRVSRTNRVCTVSKKRRDGGQSQYTSVGAER